MPSAREVVNAAAHHVLSSLDLSRPASAQADHKKAVVISRQQAHS